MTTFPKNIRIFLYTSKYKNYFIDMVLLTWFGLVVLKDILQNYFFLKYIRRPKYLLGIEFAPRSRKWWYLNINMCCIFFKRLDISNRLTSQFFWMISYPYLMLVNNKDRLASLFI